MTADPKTEKTLECDELWGNVQAKCEQNPTKKFCERALEGYQAVLDGTIEELRQQRKENRQNRENRPSVMQTVPDDKCFELVNYDTPDCKAAFNKLFNECGDMPDNAECKVAIARMGAMFQTSPMALLGEQATVGESGFDWKAGAIGVSVGFVAGYALMKAFRRKGDDEFSRA